MTMVWINKLERRFGRYAVHNLPAVLIAGQSFFYVLDMMGRLDRGKVLLTGTLVLRGEWWRLLSFPFDPPSVNLLFALFAWYLFYMMGSALEELWGAFRFNLFLLTGYLLTIGIALLVPHAVVSNGFLGGSVFLAFAFLFPDFQLLLFFVLPVRIKWLAIITWLGYGWVLLIGSWSARLLILASLGNFFLFFARDIFVNLKYGRKQLSRRVSTAPSPKAGPFHRCLVCGVTDETHPHMDFRYCPECKGQCCYCREHIFQHEHHR
jgi:hypothetical protein